MYAPEIAVPVATSSRLSTSLLPTTTPLPTTLSTTPHSATHPSAEPSNNGNHVLTDHGQGSLRTTAQATSCDRSCKLATATIIPICFVIMLAVGVWCVWGEKWRGEKRRRKTERMERDIELRKIGGEEEEEEMGGYGQREVKRDSGVGSVVGSVSDVAVVRQVEVVEGREAEEAPVDGKVKKARRSWWAR